MSIRAPERVEIPESEAPRERFARLLAIAIVIATLGVAGVEFLHSIAENHADAAGVQAQQLGVERQGQQARAIEQTHSDIDTFNLSRVQQTEEGVAFQEYLRPSVAPSSDQETEFTNANDRWRQLAALTLDLTSIKSDSPNGPEQDLFFPNAAYADATVASDRLFALEDAQNSEQHSWDALLSQYSVILTMLAISVYLFGLSLTLQRRVALFMTGFAITLVVISGLWTAGLQLARPTLASDGAADAYAQGNLLSSTQYNSPGISSLQAADADFTKAIGLRPDFAYAYLQRSQVRFLIGSPQRTESFVSITTNDALTASDADLQKAYDLGLRTKTLLNNLAANRLLLAIEDGQSSGYDQATDYLDQALAIDASDPLLYYNRSIADLGKGDTQGASVDLDTAIQHTLYLDVSKNTPRNDPAIESGLVNTQLTVLDILAAHRSDLRSEINQMKAHVVTGVELNAATPPSNHPQVSGVSLDVFPAQLQWVATIPNLNTAKDDVSAQWYHQAAPNLGWSVLNGVSGKVIPQPNGATPDRYFGLTDSLSTEGSCLPATGNYRVELYINGQLAATQTTAAPSLPALTAERVTDIGVGLCRPADWKPPTSGVFTGFNAGFTSPNGTAGVYLFHYAHVERSPGDTDQDVVTTFRDGLVKYLNDQKLLPGTATLGPAATSTGFLGMTTTARSYYTYAGGEALVSAGLMADGSVMLEVNFDTTDNFTAANATTLRVFDSAVLLG